MSGKFCNRYLDLGFSAIEEKEMEASGEINDL